MRRIVIAGVSALLLAGTVAGCSSSHPAGAGSGAPSSAGPVASAAPDPCKLIDDATVVSVAKLAAGSTGVPTSSTEQGLDDRECTWGDPQGSDNVVVDTVAMTKALFDSARSGIESALGYKNTNIPDLGEEGYIDPNNPGTVDFYQTGVWYEVQVQHDEDSNATIAAQALALAKVLAAKV